VSPQQIEAALANAYGSRRSRNIYTATNQYFVILELEPRYQRDPAALSMLLRAFIERGNWCRSTR